MYDPELLLDRLRITLTALERIPRRFVGISEPADFRTTDSGIDRMDAICMILVAAGEEFKNIDRHTKGQLFARYPQVQWRGAMGLRDVLAHGYFDVDTEQLYAICAERIPGLIATIQLMIKDIEDGTPS